MNNRILQPPQQRPLRPVRWLDEGLVLLDQRLLPQVEVYLHFDSCDGVASAIGEMVVRGAPAIGLAAAYGAVLAARETSAECVGDFAVWRRQFNLKLDLLASSRPTAVNLFWALARVRERLEALIANDVSTVVEVAEAELLGLADQLLQEDIEQGQLMAQLGAERIDPGSVVLTHCNAGGLATGGVGTALGVIKQACSQSKINRVYASETRPWLQGMRLTAWELLQEGIVPCVVVEGAIGALMRSGVVDWLIVGADRIAANGDVANKVGTYNAALLAREHGVRTMVVAPSSTVDLSLENGDGIEIEQRGSAEIVQVQGVELAPAGVETWNPVFDVTPSALVDLLVTDKGVVEPPFEGQLARLLG